MTPENESLEQKQGAVARDIYLKEQRLSAICDELETAAQSLSYASKVMQKGPIDMLLVDVEGRVVRPTPEREPALTLMEWSSYERVKELAVEMDACKQALSDLREERKLLFEGQA